MVRTQHIGTLAYDGFNAIRPPRIPSHLHRVGRRHVLAWRERNRQLYASRCTRGGCPLELGAPHIERDGDVVEPLLDAKSHATVVVEELPCRDLRVGARGCVGVAVAGQRGSRMDRQVGVVELNAFEATRFRMQPMTAFARFPADFAIGATVVGIDAAGGHMARQRVGSPQRGRLGVVLAEQTFHRQAEHLMDHVTVGLAHEAAVAEDLALLVVVGVVDRRVASHLGPGARPQRLLQHGTQGQRMVEHTVLAGNSTAQHGLQDDARRGPAGRTPIDDPAGVCQQCVDRGGAGGVELARSAARRAERNPLRQAVGLAGHAHDVELALHQHQAVARALRRQVARDHAQRHAQAVGRVDVVAGVVHAHGDGAIGRAAHADVLEALGAQRLAQCDELFVGHGRGRRGRRCGGGVGRHHGAGLFRSGGCHAEQCRRRRARAHVGRRQVGLQGHVGHAQAVLREGLALGRRGRRRRRRREHGGRGRRGGDGRHGGGAAVGHLVQGHVEADAHPTARGALVAAQAHVGTHVGRPAGRQPFRGRVDARAGPGLAVDVLDMRLQPGQGAVGRTGEGAVERRADVARGAAACVAHGQVERVDGRVREHAIQRAEIAGLAANVGAAGCDLPAAVAVELGAGLEIEGEVADAAVAGVAVRVELVTGNAAGDLQIGQQAEARDQVVATGAVAVRDRTAYHFIVIAQRRTSPGQQLCRGGDRQTGRTARVERRCNLCVGWGHRRRARQTEQREGGG